MTRAHRDTAQHGGWHGAAAYGYREGGLIDPAEAAVVGQMVEDYLAGCSESEIARRLNARSVPTPGTSTGWHRSMVQAILRSDRLHHVRRPADSVVVAGQWEPLIPEDTVKLLGAVLLARAHGSTSSSQSLLGGLACCGRCGRRLRVSISGRQVRRYTCRRSAGGCGNGIAADRTDDLMSKMWAKARHPARIPVSDIVEEIVAEEADWADTVTKYVGGDLEAETLERRRVLHAANTASLATAVIGVTPVSLAAWTAMRIPERRRSLLHRFAAVEIAPAVRSGCFDPTRIHAIPHGRCAAQARPAERTRP